MSQRSLHTGPQVIISENASLAQTSSLPSRECLPPTRRTSPIVQGWATVDVNFSLNYVFYVHRYDKLSSSDKLKCCGIKISSLRQPFNTAFPGNLRIHFLWVASKHISVIPPKQSNDILGEILTTHFLSRGLRLAYSR